MVPAPVRGPVLSHFDGVPASPAGQSGGVTLAAIEGLRRMRIHGG